MLRVKDRVEIQSFGGTHVGRSSAARSGQSAVPGGTGSGAQSTVRLQSGVGPQSGELYRSTTDSIAGDTKAEPSVPAKSRHNPHQLEVKPAPLSMNTSNWNDIPGDFVGGTSKGMSANLAQGSYLKGRSARLIPPGLRIKQPYAEATNDPAPDVSPSAVPDRTTEGLIESTLAQLQRMANDFRTTSNDAGKLENLKTRKYLLEGATRLESTLYELKDKLENLSDNDSTSSAAYVRHLKEQMSWLIYKMGVIYGIAHFLAHRADIKDFFEELYGTCGALTEEIKTQMAETIPEVETIDASACTRQVPNFPHILGPYASEFLVDAMNSITRSRPIPAARSAASVPLKTPTLADASLAVESETPSQPFAQAGDKATSLHPPAGALSEEQNDHSVVVSLREFTARQHGKATTLDSSGTALLEEQNDPSVLLFLREVTARQHRQPRTRQPNDHSVAQPRAQIPSNDEDDVEESEEEYVIVTLCDGLIKQSVSEEKGAENLDEEYGEELVVVTHSDAELEWSNCEAKEKPQQADEFDPDRFKDRSPLHIATMKDLIQAHLGVGR